MTQNQKTFSFSNLNNFFSIPNINLKYGANEDNEENVLNYDEFQRLKHYKNKIDDLEDTNQWDDSKKLSNLYELIYLQNKKQKCDSISKYEPLSRSYFKLWEIINDFNLLNLEKDLNFASIAEGPGGFIEAIINFRKQFKNIKKRIQNIMMI